MEKPYDKNQHTFPIKISLLAMRLVARSIVQRRSNCWRGRQADDGEKVDERNDDTGVIFWP